MPRYPRSRSPQPLTHSRIRVPWGLAKQQRKAGLFIKFVMLVEEQLPGATGVEKKRWVKKKLDQLINLPPIAEQISDLVIEVGVEIAYAGVQAAKVGSEYTVILKTDLEAATLAHSELVADHESLKESYRSLYAQWEATKK